MILIYDDDECAYRDDVKHLTECYARNNIKLNVSTTEYIMMIGAYMY